MSQKSERKEIAADSSPSTDALSGVYDIHIHTAPDVVPRKCSDIELGARLRAAGMGGCVIKNHYAGTAGRAALLKEIYPELAIAGGIVLNRSVGGFNREAVEKTALLGGRIVWFPTMDGLEYQRYRNAGKKEPEPGLLTVFGEGGKLLPQVGEILKAAAYYDLAVGTGHLGAEEGMAVVRAAAGCGVRRIILTHADNPADFYTLEQQREAVSLGAMVEHCYFTVYYNKTDLKEVVRQIRSVGCEHVVLSTDFGQPSSPHSDEGMGEFLERLRAEGFTEEELSQMAKVDPVKLIW